MIAADKYKSSPETKVAELLKEFSVDKALDIAETMKGFALACLGKDAVKWWDKVIKQIKTTAETPTFTPEPNPSDILVNALERIEGTLEGDIELSPTLADILDIVRNALSEYRQNINE